MQKICLNKVSCKKRLTLILNIYKSDLMTVQFWYQALRWEQAEELSLLNAMILKSFVTMIRWFKQVYRNIELQSLNCIIAKIILKFGFRKDKSQFSR